ncbi:MAG TPA: serine/threonine-protein kinase, partial [Kofleriaceae bacterium]|nr:serine/threonine-protein kinase [Kofleriaceae bacterium]
MGSAEEFGPYVVYEQLGLGGMATVHRAETQGIAGFSKQVALKRMLPNVAADANLVKSFIREARLASHLRHANVAQTYDLGKVGDTYFIAMELVPGRNLREVLKQCAATKRNAPLPIALNIVAQICDALDYAHNLCDETGQPLGIIHRDVSPANVIIGESGIAKLIDFGIAKASSGGMQTMSGTIKGKFSYMAPEYLMGHIDWRADLFAVGVIAHELLSNKPLFQGKDDMDTLYRVKDMPILPPSRFNPAVPPEVDSIVMTALERDPNRRWQQASAMRAALTTECARLGLVAQNLQIETWLDETFAGGTDDLEAPEISMGGGSTVELSKGSVPDDFLGAAADSMSTLVRPAGSQPIQAQGTPITHAKDDSPTLTERKGTPPPTLERASSPRPR